MRWIGCALVTAALAGCGWQGPALHGQPGLQYDVISFYGSRAMERSATCPNPQMQSVTGTKVIEDTPERLVMEVRYYWVDWSQAVDLAGGSITTCRDWSSRVFTFSRATDGTLQVQSMTGEQKRA